MKKLLRDKYVLNKNKTILYKKDIKTYIKVSKIYKDKKIILFAYLFLKYLNFKWHKR